MGRPIKPNKKPMTTISIEVNLVTDMEKYKTGAENWTDFIERLFVEYKQNHPVLQARFF
jgi:predicted CopG family antitoxin